MTTSALNSTQGKSRSGRSGNSRTSRRRLPERVKQEAVRLRSAGETFRGIAGKLGISHEWAHVLCEGVERGEVEVPVKPEPVKSDQENMLDLLSKDFAMHCRRLRTALKLTQSKFGLMLGLGSAAGVIISRWEAAAHVPQKKWLLRFMKLQNQYDRKI